MGTRPAHMCIEAERSVEIDTNALVGAANAKSLSERPGEHSGTNDDASSDTQFSQTDTTDLSTCEDVFGECEETVERLTGCLSTPGLGELFAVSLTDDGDSWFVSFEMKQRVLEKDLAHILGKAQLSDKDIQILTRGAVVRPFLGLNYIERGSKFGVVSTQMKDRSLVKKL